MSRVDLFISIISPTTPFKRNANRIIKQYKGVTDSISEQNLSLLNIAINVYERSNAHVLKMMKYLATNLQKDLVGAYVHGSLGTNEEIAYSDFDALVIIRNEAFDTPQRLATVAQKLSNARSIMFDFDPLQHHGWFVLTEADLKCYPQHYFPVELYGYAKSLLPDQGLNFKVYPNNSSEKVRDAFLNLSSSVIKRITKKAYPKNMYELKRLLSQFMLLPTLYCQFRDGNGIYKKFSFGSAKPDFSDKDWSILDEVSLLRENWFYKISPFRRWLITRSSQISRYLAKTYAPPIPNRIEKMLTNDFYQRVLHLVNLMKINLQ